MASSPAHASVLSQGAQVALADAVLAPDLLLELWHAAEAGACGLRADEFERILLAVALKLNYNQRPGAAPTAAERVTFFRGLKLADLALAHACALGRELAWERFLSLYRAALTQAAIAIAGSATLGEELANSLYGDLYGLRMNSAERRSPLASYTGRGSLMGWLRTTLAQRHVDHHRRTHRETALDEAFESNDAPQPIAAEPAPQPAELTRLQHALRLTLTSLPAEARLILVAYFLDRRTLAEIARLAQVHEATISRRLKRLTEDLRKQLLANLQAGGLSKRAAEEALGTDPRDIEINLRALLQTSQTPAFQVGEGSTQQQART